MDSIRKPPGQLGLWVPESLLAKQSLCSNSRIGAADWERTQCTIGCVRVGRNALGIWPAILTASGLAAHPSEDVETVRNSDEQSDMTSRRRPRNMTLTLRVFLEDELAGT